MGNIGYGYGSECHLLRYLGRHRKLLDAKVAEQTGASSIDWLDFGFDATTAWGDSEPKGLSFLPFGPGREAWQRFWPSRGSPPNWDAIARIDIRGQREWLLVEAKGNVEELNSSCSAQEGGSGLAKIAAAMKSTKAALGVAQDRDWLNGYYQLANRIAVLQFLMSIGESARLCLIYFLDDKNGERSCPPTEEAWVGPLQAQAEHLGLDRMHPLSDRIHKLFLDARPSDAVRRDQGCPG